jgi:hypothetical protein
MTTSPDLTVLLNLTDRAEKGRLSADEAQLLRDGIQHLHQQQTTANRTIGGLQNRIRELKNKDSQ